jgi:hypothetical protein
MVDEIGRPYEFLFGRLDGEGVANCLRMVLELLAPFLPAGRDR